MSRAVTDTLRDGFAGNLTTLAALQGLAGLTHEQAARFLFVSPETYRRWRTDRQPNPTAVRLLAIRAGYLPWPQWSDWEMHRGFLFPPGLSRHGLGPQHIHLLPLLQQEVRELRRQVRVRDMARNLEPKTEAR